MVGRAWDALPDHEESSVPLFCDTVVPVVEAAQRQSVRMLDGFCARESDRSALGLDPKDLVGAAARKETSPSEVYRRPFVELWSLLKEGRLWEDANHAARARLLTAVETDILRAQMLAAARVVELDPGTRSMERVLRGTCEKCAEAQRNGGTVETPIHPGCQCSVVPSSSKPGQKKEPVHPQEAYGDRTIRTKHLDDPNEPGSTREQAVEGGVFTADDAAALRAYCGREESFTLNRLLRRGEVPPETKALDTAMEHAGPVGTPTRVWRGTNINPLHFDADSWDDLVGRTITDKGFGSTSASENWAFVMSRGKNSVTFEINMDPRVKAIWGANPLEEELLLERGCRYVIRGVEREMFPPLVRGGKPFVGKTKVIVDLLPPEAS